MKLRNRAPVTEPPPAESIVEAIARVAENEQLTAHLREHERLLTLAADRLALANRLLARITDLHSHDNLTGCCLTCGRAGPCKTTRILTGESR